LEEQTSYREKQRYKTHSSASRGEILAPHRIRYIGAEVSPQQIANISHLGQFEPTGYAVTELAAAVRGPSNEPPGLICGTTAPLNFMITARKARKAGQTPNLESGSLGIAF
jgi:hypothetical protein